MDIHPIVEKLMWLLATIVVAFVGYVVRGFVQRVDNKVDKPTCEAIQQREDIILDGLKKDVHELKAEFGSKSMIVMDNSSKVLEKVNALLEQQKSKRRKKS